jgi:hypothetical protein
MARVTGYSTGKPDPGESKRSSPWEKDIKKSLIFGLISDILELGVRFNTLFYI